MVDDLSADDRRVRLTFDRRALLISQLIDWKRRAPARTISSVI